MNLNSNTNNSVILFEDEVIVRSRSSDDIKKAVAFFLISFCNFFVLSMMLTVLHHSLTAALVVVPILLTVFKLTPFFMTFYFKTRTIVWLISSSIGIIAFILNCYDNSYKLVTGISVFVFLIPALGFCEANFLSHSAEFKSNSINGWTLGKSFAELLVFILRQMFGILYFRTTLSIYIILLSFPIIQGATIYYLFKQRAQTDYSIINENETTVFGTKEKFRFFPKILKYLAPLVLVYFSQHFAMICLENLDDFHNTKLPDFPKFLFYLSVVVASVKSFNINQIWIPALLHFLNMIILVVTFRFGTNFTEHVIWFLIPMSIWLGLTFGTVYLNTFLRIHSEENELRKKFTLGATTIGSSIGLLLAGVLDIVLSSIWY